MLLSGRLFDREREKMLARRLYFVLLFFFFIQSSFFFVVHTENGENVEGYAEIVSVESPHTIELNGTLTIFGLFQYAFSDLNAVSVRLSEVQAISLTTSDVLEYQELLVEGEGVQAFNLSAVAPSSEREWNLAVSIWVLGVTKWVLLDEYTFKVNVTLYAPQILISDFTFSDYTPTEGDTVTFSANITNTGSALGEDYARFHIDEDTIHEERLSLSIGESYIASFNWIAVEGNHTISVNFLGTIQSLQLTVLSVPTLPPPIPPTFGLQQLLPLLGALALLGGILGIAILGRRKKKPEPSLKSKVNAIEKDLAELKKEKKSSFFTKFQSKVKLYGAEELDVAWDLLHTMPEISSKRSLEESKESYFKRNITSLSRFLKKWDENKKALMKLIIEYGIKAPEMKRYIKQYEKKAIDPLRKDLRHFKEEIQKLRTKNE